MTELVFLTTESVENTSQPRVIKSLLALELMLLSRRELTEQFLRGRSVASDRSPNRGFTTEGTEGDHLKFQISDLKFQITNSLPAPAAEAAPKARRKPAAKAVPKPVAAKRPALRVVAKPPARPRAARQAKVAS